METIGNPEPVPAWLSARIRRAAFFSALLWLTPLLAAASLFAGIACLIWLGEAKSKFPPLFWMAGFLVAMCLLGREVYRAVAVCLNPEKSVEAAYLRRFGPLAATIAQIEGELQSPDALKYREDAAITQNWLIVSSGSRFAARRLDDLIWAFLKKTTTRINWVLPVWSSNSAVFRTADAPDSEVKCSTDWGNRFLERAGGRCPWIVLGYDAKMQELWDRDRAAFAALVEERKKGR